MDKELLRQRPFYLNDEEIDWVYKTLGELTEDEKIGQLFCVNIREGSIEELDHFFNIVPYGGVMYRPLETESAVELSNYLKKAKVPMFIAADLERGGQGALVKGTKMANQMQIAAAGSKKADYARKLAVVCGEEGKSVGVNWAFAPDVDIDFNYRNPITNVRTYGSNPVDVALLGATYISNLQQEGIAATAKHFPGDGIDDRDHHLVTNVNTLSVEEWDATYGKVYKACIDAGVLSVMVGHIMQPAYSKLLNPEIEDKDIMPATLSKELIQGLLRGKLGFNGLVVTDATTMSGFTIPMPRKLSVPTTIAAGADVFLFSRNMEEDVAFMKEGYKNGIITPERLDEAVIRILAMKAHLKLYKPQEEQYSVKRAENEIGKAEYHCWARELADDSITIVKEEPGVLSLSPKKYPRLMYFPIETAGYDGFLNKAETFKQMLIKEGFEVSEFNPARGMEGFLAPTTEYIGKYDVMVYFACVSTRSNQTTVRIQWEAPLGANCPHYITSIPTVFISVENPYHLQDVPRIRTYINAYSSHQEVLEEVLEKLMGRSEFKGESPCDPFCGRWDTHLQ